MVEQFSIKHRLAIVLFRPHSAAPQNKHTVVFVCSVLASIPKFQTNIEAFDIRKKQQNAAPLGANHNRTSRQTKGNFKHLKVPWDFAKARNDKEAPQSIEACEQSACAGWENRMGSAGGKKPAMVLQNDVNRVLHCKLSICSNISGKTQIKSILD